NTIQDSILCTFGQRPVFVVFILVWVVSILIITLVFRAIPFATGAVFLLITIPLRILLLLAVATATALVFLLLFLLLLELGNFVILTGSFIAGFLFQRLLVILCSLRMTFHFHSCIPHIVQY